MKIVKILLLAVFTIGLTVSASAQKKSTETVVFKASVTCQKCVNKVEKNIPFEKGVKDVKVNLETKEVTVTFDPKKTDKEKVKKALEKIDLAPQEVVKEEKKEEKK